MELFVQKICKKTGKSPQDYDRTRKTLQNQKKEERRGRTGEKEAKGNEMGPALPGGSWKEEYAPAPQDVPPPAMRSAENGGKTLDKRSEAVKKETVLQKWLVLWAMDNCRLVPASVGN